MHINSPVAQPAACSKAVDPVLLILCLLLLPLFVGVLCLVLVLLCSTKCLSSLMGKRDLDPLIKFPGTAHVTSTLVRRCFDAMCMGELIMTGPNVSLCHFTTL